MNRILIVGLALAVGGCTLFFEPDRDDIIRPDGGPDTGVPDGGDAGHDAGLDADIDGGCVPEQEFETSCNDLMDNDCDGVVDCDELECGASGFCCNTGGGGAWSELSPFTIWDAYGSVSTVAANNVVFGTSPGDVSLSFSRCAPIAFGMSFRLDFQVVSGGGPDEFASFLLAPVADPGVGSFLGELRIRVGSDGHAQALRAGSVIGTTTSPIPAGMGVTALVSLSPGVDGMGRPVLYLDAEIGGQDLAVDEILMPLEDLRPSTVGCSPDGLFLAVEGRGTQVTIVSALSASTGDCDNPSQFLEDSSGPLGAPTPIADRFESMPSAWRAGGLGEPALSNFGVGTLASERLEVFADTSTRERRDEFLQPTYFSIGGVTRAGGSWNERGPMGAPELLGPTPSSREPSLFAPNTDGVLSGSSLFVAYARTAVMDGPFEIALTSIDLTASDVPAPGYTVLTVGDETNQVSGCEELRDPSLIALGPNPASDGMLLFFTCDPTGTAPSWIGAAHLTFDGTSEYEVAEIFPSLLTSDLGEYADQGALSPEVVITSTAGGTLELRVWFLAKNSSGRARVAFAFGQVDADGVPHLSAFGGNPILDPEDPVLGGPCAVRCTIDSLGVIRTVATGLWSEPSYVFLIERSVFDTASVTHELIPLRQPRPTGG